jgi:hypothetical protein
VRLEQLLDQKAVPLMQVIGWTEQVVQIRQSGHALRA